MVLRFSKPLGWIALLAVFLLVSAVFISLSNYVDRKTILILNPGGVEFHNGLRNAQLSWDQVEKVSVFEDRWGERVHVSGTETHFNFRLLSEVELRGKAGGKMGFPDGEMILKEIINSSGLRLAENKDHDRYYIRS